MSTIAAHVCFVDPALDWETDLRRARMLAKLLDAQFSVAGFRFGIDALIDLVPIGGDVIGTVLGLYPIYLAHKHQLGRTVELRMAWNLAIEFVGGRDSRRRERFRRRLSRESEERFAA